MEGKEENWEKRTNIPGINKTKPLTEVTTGMALSRELSSAATVLVVRKSTPWRLTFTTSRSNVRPFPDVLYCAHLNRPWVTASHLEV
jgi:hypothetical protein